jgi:hypothetical protein
MEHHKQLVTRFGVTSDGIPPEYVARKYSSTCLYEPEDMLWHHNRDVLRDNTVEPPSLESDMPRYKTARKDVLNIRFHGARSQVRPEHPEIYLANTTRDNRGSQTMPDMRQHKEAMEYRIENYKDFVNDNLADQTEDSGTWEAPAIIKALRGTWEKFKRRATWFDTSLSAEYHGHNQRQSSTSKMRLIKRDDNDKVRVLSEMPSSVFTNSKVVLSNPNRKKVIVGRREVPTHRFTVAKYGRAPPSVVRHYDATKKMDYVTPTQEFKNSEEHAMRALAIVMSAEAGDKHRDMAECTTSFDESAKTMTDRHKGKHPNVRRALDNTENTQDIVENMVVILEGRQARHQQDGDLQARRHHGYYDPELYDAAQETEHRVVKLIEDPFASAKMKRYALTEIDEPGSMETAIYSTSHQPTIEQIRDAQRKGLIDYEKEESVTVYRGKQGPTEAQRLNTIGSLRQTDETRFDDSAVKARIVGPIGQKSRIRRHVRYEPVSGLGDIESNHSR